MSKSYRKPTVPSTKKVIVGVDEDTGNIIYEDTRLPVITTQSEFIQEAPVKYIDRECISCGVKFGLDTDIEYKRCFECRSLDKELENKMTRLARLSREGIVPEKDTGILGVKHAGWQPNQWDKISFDRGKETNKVCSSCYVVLPLSYGSKRLCESCRKD